MMQKVSLTKQNVKTRGLLRYMGGATYIGGGEHVPPPQKVVVQGIQKVGYRVQGQLLDTDTDTDTCEMNTFAHPNSKTMAQKVTEPLESLKFSIVHFNQQLRQSLNSGVCQNRYVLYTDNVLRR